MQINFNPHLPPGYLETHSMDDAGWRSERPVRKALTERAVATVVRRFEREYQAEMQRQSREECCGVVEKKYTTGGVNLLVIKHPWESIPLVIIDRERGKNTP